MWRATSRGVAHGRKPRRSDTTATARIGCRPIPPALPGRAAPTSPSRSGDGISSASTGTPLPAGRAGVADLEPKAYCRFSSPSRWRASPGTALLPGSTQVVRAAWDASYPVHRARPEEGDDPSAAGVPGVPPPGRVGGMNGGSGAETRWRPCRVQRTRGRVTDTMVRKVIVSRCSKRRRRASRRGLRAPHSGQSSPSSSHSTSIRTSRVSARKCTSATRHGESRGRTSVKNCRLSITREAYCAPGDRDAFTPKPCLSDSPGRLGRAPGRQSEPRNAPVRCSATGPNRSGPRGGQPERGAKSRGTGRASSR